jgi:hypothetical protein
MMAKFDRVSLHSFGKSLPQTEGQQRGVLTLNLDRDDQGFYPEVGVEVMVERRAGVTWAEVEAQARDYAIDNLRIVLEALEGATISELRERAEAHQELRARQADERLQRHILGTGTGK